MNFPAFLTYAVITTYTPGPNNIMAMTLGSKYGFRKVLRFCLGVAIGFAIVQACVAAFCTLLASILPQIQGVMSYIGAAYILYLAYTVVRDKPHKEQDGRMEPQGLLSAVLLQFVNPKGIVYGITIMTGYILPYYNTIPMIGLLILLLALLTLGSTVLWALAGTGIEKLFSKHKKIINIIMALLLVYCAVSLLLPH